MMPAMPGAKVLLLSALAFLAPDVLPPGHKSVRHEMAVEGTVPAGFRLVASPVRGFGGVHEVQSGQPFSFSSKYGTRLYLLPLDQPLPSQWSEAWLEQHPHSDTFAEVASVPAGTPLARVLTTWRIDGVDGQAIRLERLGEERFDGFGARLPAGGEWWWLLVVAAGGAVLAVRLWRSRPAGGVTC